MEFAKLLGICVLGAFFCLWLKNASPPFSVLLTLFISVTAGGACVMYFLPFLEFFGEIIGGTAFSAYAAVLMKVCGIGILTRLAAEICRDAGESSIASKAMLVGKTAVMLCALPVIKTLFEQIKELLN